MFTERERDGQLYGVVGNVWYCALCCNKFRSSWCGPIRERGPIKVNPFVRKGHIKIKVKTKWSKIWEGIKTKRVGGNIYIRNDWGGKMRSRSSTCCSFYIHFSDFFMSRKTFGRFLLSFLHYSFHSAAPAGGIWNEKTIKWGDSRSQKFSDNTGSGNQDVHLVVPSVGREEDDARKRGRLASLCDWCFCHWIMRWAPFSANK